jgi:hypothetical protein
MWFKLNTVEFGDFSFNNDLLVGDGGLLDVYCIKKFYAVIGSLLYHKFVHASNIASLWVDV